MSMINTYLDNLTYQNAATGIQTSSLVGNSGRLSPVALGATSLTVVAPLTVALNQYDPVYIFDGPNSELLQVGSGGATIGATSIPLQAGASAAHAGGTAYCTDGTQGSLGQALCEASRWIEDICHQALWSTTYTGEILTMPTMRASIDNQYNLHFRPRHFPITALSTITIQVNQTYTVPLDATQAIIDADQQTVDIPNVNYLNSGYPPTQGMGMVWYPISRQVNAWLSLTYTAGFAVGNLPWTVTRAAMLLTNEMFSQMENPIGADSIVQGKRNVNFVVKGDTSGDSLLVKQATKLLNPYITQAF